MTKIASVAMSVDPRDKQRNIQVMDAYIEQAGSQGVELIVFPEMAVCGYGTKGMNEYCGEDHVAYIDMAEPVPQGETVRHFEELARKHSMHIVFGMGESDPDRFDVVYNTAVLLGPDGFIGSYRKVHQPLNERFVLYPGCDEPPVFDTSLGKIGLQICFDKCFPEFARILALKGAQIIVNPVCWPNFSGKEDDPDQVAYELYGCSRAAENMVFIVESNHSGTNMAATSRIVGPYPGKVYASTGIAEGMAVADVDVPGDIIKARAFAMGGSDFLKERKPSMYTRICQRDPYTQAGVDVNLD